MVPDILCWVVFRDLVLDDILDVDDALSHGVALEVLVGCEVGDFDVGIIMRRSRDHHDVVETQITGIVAANRNPIARGTEWLVVDMKVDAYRLRGEALVVQCRKRRGKGVNLCNRLRLQIVSHSAVKRLEGSSSYLRRHFRRHSRDSRDSRY